MDSENGTSIFERMTLMYAIGEKHGLFELLKAAGTFNETNVS